ncbi:MAG: sugar phosphate isomerase/epimerase [Planctomycetia bacterium]|nr:sugar phosphate isomerase/epimerase [Planctomycetia bacterium]
MTAGPMTVGIDNYCYHRFFGEIYAQQKDPGRRITIEWFVDRAKQLGVDGVSLESCFFSGFEPAYLDGLKSQLDAAGLIRVFAWGHPDGLEGGKSKTAYQEMVEMIPHARRLGADVMRVVGSSLMFRFENHQEQIERLTGMFREAVRVAADHGVKLAIENHIDFTSDEIVQLLDQVDSDHLGVNFDTANFARLLDDPVKGMRKLAPRVLATHIKDLKVNAQASVDDWFFFSSTPVGDGFVDNLALARLLKEAGYKGFLAVETDFLHPDYADEDEAVAQSVVALKKIAAQA